MTGAARELISRQFRAGRAIYVGPAGIVEFNQAPSAQAFAEAVTVVGGMVVSIEDVTINTPSRQPHTARNFTRITFILPEEIS